MCCCGCSSKASVKGLWALMFSCFHVSMQKHCSTNIEDLNVAMLICCFGGLMCKPGVNILGIDVEFGLFWSLM
jgi:hypothetical protein